MKSLFICTTSEYEAEIMTIFEKILKFAYKPFSLFCLWIEWIENLRFTCSCPAFEWHNSPHKKNKCRWTNLIQLEYLHLSTFTTRTNIWLIGWTVKVGLFSNDIQGQDLWYILNRATVLESILDIISLEYVFLEGLRDQLLYVGKGQEHLCYPCPLLHT